MEHPAGDAREDAAPGGEITREELHWRRIDFRGYRRSDGLLEVEARLTDRKTHDFAPPSGGRYVVAGDTIHDHGLRVVFGEDMVIREMGTAIRAYPYRECPGGGEVLQSLVGLRIGPGWTSELRKRLPSGDTCTHLKEMMIPLASAAFQTVYSVRKGHVEDHDASGRPRKIDSCYAYGAARELVAVQWPDFHRPPVARDGQEDA
ncbi:DUF2889 domain-containing protein [Pseudorhodoferax sp.]|uniref:DUF2889 domain-containing protein n=1 Tax=Pseudorhodoferax sp. TaxID=1993553 RepID=UPI0039E56AA9